MVGVATVIPIIYFFLGGGGGGEGVWLLFCCAVLSVVSSFAISSLGRELVALL